jgi:hypothetical protein
MKIKLPRVWVTLILVAVAPMISASDLSREANVYAAKSWSDVRKTYRRFGGNADGVVAGAYVDKISELLDEQWSSVNDLNRLTKHDIRFQLFVLKHLNEAVSADRANRIKHNAEQMCPSEAHALCEKISSRL